MLQSSPILKADRTSPDTLSRDTFCDWIEASTLFKVDPVLSFPDVVTLLVGEELCEDQAEAWVCLNDATRELRRRSMSFGAGYPLFIKKNHYERKRKWRECPAYSFCLLLSLAEVYPAWANGFGHNYTVQGELFERVTTEALKHILKAWRVQRTGWSTSQPRYLRDVVAEVVKLIGEPAGDLRRWADEHAKESGLDILCFRPFLDGRGGFPLYLVQCASGRDYRNKLRDPDLSLWKKLLDTASEPQRAVAVPYALLDKEFQRHALRVQGILLDRYRLLEPLKSSASWLPERTKRDIIRWSLPRVKALPWAI